MPEFNKLLPDCGYQLRSVEFEAFGTVVETDSDAGTTALEVTGGGTVLELAGVDEAPPGEVRMTGVIGPPFDGAHLQVVVQELAPR